MPPRVPPLPLPNELSMPVRDILRGLRHGLGQPPRLAEPVDAALPGILRNVATQVAELASAGLPPARSGTQAALDRAAELSGLTPDKATADLAAHIIYHGSNFALSHLGRGDLMVSETVARIAYDSAMAQADGDSFERAGALYQSLLSHHVVGVAPGTGIGLTEADRAPTQTALLAVLLWMLVERNGAPQPEAEVLTLCVDVATSILAEAAPGDPADLAQIFKTHAGVI